nr:RNA polymerase sigma factor SigZ [Thaumasiovibrio subtropicus]
MNIDHIWAQYRRSLQGFLSKKVANPDDAEDLLQEILIKSYQQLDTIKDAAKLKAWLFQIAHHTIIDFYRSRGRSSLDQLTDVAMSEIESEEWEADVYEALTPCLLPFIEALPDEEATLLKAVEIEGRPQKVLAEQLGLNYSTLKSRVKRSRQSLYTLFNRCCAFSLDKHGNLVDYAPRKREEGGCCG